MKSRKTSLEKIIPSNIRTKKQFSAANTKLFDKPKGKYRDESENVDQLKFERIEPADQSHQFHFQCKSVIMNFWYS